MTTPISQLLQKSILRTLSLTLLSLILATPLLIAQKTSPNAAAQKDSSSATLVQQVREGTRHFIDVNNATAAGYGPFLGCVAGTDHGAMGVHYVNGTLLKNLTLDPAQPQALIYVRGADVMSYVKRAGGFSDIANKGHILIIHPDGTTQIGGTVLPGDRILVRSS